MTKKKTGEIDYSQLFLATMPALLQMARERTEAIQRTMAIQEKLADAACRLADSLQMLAMAHALQSPKPQRSRSSTRKHQRSKS